MTADRKAAMEQARSCIYAPYENLAAAFREVTAELEQERKAREEADRLLRETWTHIKATVHRAESAEQRCAQIERETIERCAKVCEERAAKKRDMKGTYKHDEEYCADAIRAIAPTNAAGQEAKRQSLGEDDDPSEQPASAAPNNVQFWCDHVGGSGPPFPLCTICQKKAEKLVAANTADACSRRPLK